MQITIEHDPICFLEAGGMALKLATCRVLHPCPGCKGDGCWRCDRTGVGPIQGPCLTYCEACGRTNRDFDPRLRLLPGDTPRPDPKPPIEIPDDLLGKRGGLRKQTVEERQAEEVKARREARKAARAYRAKAKSKAKAKKEAERAADKARGKYVPPWKQTPPV